jgi:hypothetical protein
LDRVCPLARAKRQNAGATTWLDPHRDDLDEALDRLAEAAG